MGMVKGIHCGGRGYGILHDCCHGYRYRVPYGTLLSVSDLPLHAVPKLPAQAQAFYSNSKEAHVMCAVRTVEQLADNPQRLHTRKLRRTIGEVPFR